MIYDIYTSNKSFLIVSKMLRNNGVKNNKFMLALYDEGLSGIDPHSNKVKDDINFQLRIYRECCRNVWYFLREVVRIPANGANIPYELNLGNCALSYLRSYNKNFILVLPRQHRKNHSGSRPMMSGRYALQLEMLM